MADDDSPVFNLKDAYSVVTPQDNKELYARWAATYDNEFLVSHGYVYHAGVAELFARYASPGGLILDVGCGTGAVGLALAGQGLGAEIDGVDISSEMLAVAATKKQANGRPVYRNLIRADLTKPLDIESSRYSGGVISVGAFTHGHLGPQSLDELLRVGAPGSTFAIGINSAHFISLGFSEYLEQRRAAGEISPVEIVELQIYDASAATMEDKSELDAIAYVAMFINRSGE